jgi:diguanylate cyclase (GGDEF)-like protein/PAS domain S-box-containing protein
VSAGVTHGEIVRESRTLLRPKRFVRGWISLALCFAVVMTTVLLTDRFGSTHDGLNILWAANGLLLTYLLLVPRWRWPSYIAVSFAAMMIATAIGGTSWKLNLLYNALNTLEAVVAALLLRPHSRKLPRFTNRRYLLRFVAYAVFTGPAVAAALFAAAGFVVHHPRPDLLFTQWMASDSLGMAVIPPTLVAIFRSRFREIPDRRVVVDLLLLCLLAIVSFTQFQVPVSFLILPFLMLILLRHGIGWAATASLLVTAIGGSLTIHGHGPFALLSQSSPILPSVLFQAFLASGLCMLYMTSMVMENLRSVQRALNRSVSFHETVVANLNEVILVEDLDGRLTYVSPASMQVFGLTPEAMLMVKGADLVPPEDKVNLAEVFQRLREGKECGPVQFRAQRRDGTDVWVEAGLSMMRDPATGNTIGFLQIVRDIQERKKQEEQLQEAYRALEAMAVTDSLTHLANRRQFDKFVTTEWRRAMRTHEAISILVLDVDNFKSFNDTYGHLRGDNCLRQVAEATQDVVMRPADLVARIGGEEFAVVLQGSTLEGAREVAERIREEVLGRRIRHEGNPIGFVTISAGCASCIPAIGQHVRDLINVADQALYEAKRTGRNRVCVLSQERSDEAIRYAS